MSLQNAFDVQRKTVYEAAIGKWKVYVDEWSPHMDQYQCAREYCAVIIGERSKLYELLQTPGRANHPLQYYAERLCHEFERYHVGHNRSSFSFDLFVQNRLEACNALCIKAYNIDEVNVIRKNGENDLRKLIQLIGSYLGLRDCFREISELAHLELPKKAGAFFDIATSLGAPIWADMLWNQRLPRSSAGSIGNEFEKGRNWDSNDQNVQAKSTEIMLNEPQSQVTVNTGVLENTKTEKVKPMTAKQLTLTVYLLMEAPSVKTLELKQKDIKEFISRLTGHNEGTLKAHVSWAHGLKTRYDKPEESQKSRALREDLVVVKNTLKLIGLELDEGLARTLDEIIEGDSAL